MLSFLVVIFPPMGKTEWGGNPVCWWLGLYFCFVLFCLDETSCAGCYWCLSDARSHIQVFSFMGVLTIWHSLGSVLVLERTLESPLNWKKIKPVNPKGNQSWKFTGRADAEAPILWPPDAKTHWKRPWYWERLKARGEGDNRGWDGWMASPTRWTWVWASSGSWWRTGKPGVLQSIGLQRVELDWGTESKLVKLKSIMVVTWA